MAEGLVCLDENGPWLLVPDEFRPLWRGVENWQENAPNDPSDYARACRQNGYVDVIPCGCGTAAVLGGDAGSITWAQLASDTGLLIQWIACDDEADIHAIIDNKSFLANLEADCRERPEMRTGSSGRLKLFHAAERGDEAEPMLHIDLQPGTYRFWSAYMKQQSCWLVLRGLVKISGEIHADIQI